MMKDFCFIHLPKKYREKEKIFIPRPSNNKQEEWEDFARDGDESYIWDLGQLDLAMILLKELYHKT